jgi:hypothetical protein
MTMEPTTKLATATLVSHGTIEKGKRVNTVHVTPEGLALIPTPDPTRTWQPVPHIEVVRQIEQMIIQHGWKFVDATPFNICVTETYTKMFGVTKIIIPGYTDMSADMSLAMGFRNSHDKSLALSLALGTHIGVCSNLAFNGDIKLSRIHTRHISVNELLEQAFKMIPAAGKRLLDWTIKLRTKPVGIDTGISLLAEAVERKALPIGDFMDARADFQTAYTGANPQIQYGTTYWGVYQAITAQYKRHPLHVNQSYSAELNTLFIEKVGNGIKADL